MEVGEFEGITNALLKKHQERIVTSNDNSQKEDLVSSWDVPYETLLRQLSDSNTTASRLDLLQQIEAEQRARVDIEATLDGIARSLGSSMESLLEMKEIQPNDVIDDCYEASVEFYLHTC